MTQAGTFITVEGGDGSGKTTQAKLLFEALNKAGTTTILTREPGGTDGAEQIRHLLVEGETGRWDRVTELMLYFAARRDHTERLIKPALERAEWVMCDRYTDSTRAYQGYGEGVKLELIDGLHRLVLGNFEPALTLIFDLDDEEALKRAQSRQENNRHKQEEDRYERMDSVFHKNVRRGFLEIAKKEPKRCAVIDASGSIEGIHNAAVDALNLHLEMKLAPLTSANIQHVLK